MGFPVVAIGTFDGMHRGHTQLLKKARAYANAHEGQVVVLSFEPLPQEVLYPTDTNGTGNSRLLTNTEKEELLKAQGVDVLIYQAFDLPFSRIKKEDFVESYLVNKLGVKTYVLGFNHRFGYGMEGDFLWLNKIGTTHDFKVLEVPIEDFRKQTVSSAQIKKYIRKGQIHLANKFLGYNYNISGKVVKGNQIGRQLGFPTANIELSEDYEHKLLPAGVYVAKAELNEQSYEAMLNIGYRPSIRLDKHELRAEVHLFHFNKDIYGEHLKVYFLEKLRDEERFTDIQLLIEQLKQDRHKSLLYFENRKKHEKTL